MWDLKCKVKVEGILLGERMYRLYMLECIGECLEKYEM